MIIQELTLRNIRSFESANIELNEGITLLSGDIGAGKTTILIAIEFALFGLLRGKVSPEELLRHGENEGYVKLNFKVNQKEIIITRFLKRTSSGIVQPPGTLIVDGSESSYVATELKARILELLGYPSSLINKSTNLFRYTVYTPQEQVKLILFETEEERKDIIRKIFALDKYKTIISNLSPYQSNLKSTIERNKGRLEDFPLLKEQRTIKENESELLKLKIKEQTENLNKVTEERKKLSEQFSNLQKKNEEISKQKQKLNLIQQNIQNSQRIISMLEEEKKTNEQKLTSFKLESFEFDKELKIKLKTELTLLEEQRLALSQKTGEMKAKKEQVTKVTQNISSLEKCPTCKQVVGEEHKTKIKELETLALEKLEKNEDMLKKQIDDLISKINSTKEKIQLFEKEEQKYNKFLEEQKSKQIFSERIHQIQENITKHNNLLNQILQDKKSLEEKNKSLVEVPLDKEKNQLDQIQKQEREIELELQSNQTRFEICKNSIQEIQKELIEKTNLQKENSDLILVKNWFNDLFIPLLSTIERKIMLKVYREFNDLFIRWFSILIDDNSINVKLDENFTPILEQNGFDTSIENLSGGEKTSVALAYRLALNKVLNDYFGKLHTKDLIILDEPTDGFSSEQLDKLSLVLSQVNAKQIIIVSHEQKLEALAQKILRVEKNNHASKIQ
ncbi:MAG: SMC family ATPase [Candidatus Nanoarchaeia archaeon]|nr:SMC family ATPase [Candidatus Nanoarchaeia archaeon]